MAPRRPKSWVQNAGENGAVSTSELVEATVAACASVEQTAEPYLASLAAAAGRVDLALLRVAEIWDKGPRAVAAASAAVAAPGADREPLVALARATIPKVEDPGEQAVALGVLALALDRAGDREGAEASARSARALVPGARCPRAAATGLVRWHLGRGEAEAAGALLREPPATGHVTGVGADPRGFGRRAMRGLVRLGAYGLARSIGTRRGNVDWWAARTELLAAGAAPALLAMASERALPDHDDDDAHTVVLHAAARGDEALVRQAFATLTEQSWLYRVIALPGLARFDAPAARAELERVRPHLSDYANGWVAQTMVAIGDQRGAQAFVEGLPLEDGLRALRVAPEVLDDRFAAWLASRTGSAPMIEASRLGVLASYAGRSGDREESRRLLDAQLAQAVATEADRREHSLRYAVRDRLGLDDVPAAAAVVTKASNALRSDLVMPILHHLAAAGDLAGMATCLGRIVFRRNEHGSEKVEVRGHLEEVLRTIDERVDPMGADVPRPLR